MKNKKIGIEQIEMEAHLRRRPRRRSDHGGSGGWTVGNVLDAAATAWLEP
ncbi:hypothetical protein M6B38_371640 [Iris pallida]|uniref:Uncharacterized protein n=1 Tax=Iris pallida TaxID=29817 RepID=A0AAX6GE78_IRIPA|nr:hypothetical protein M6B38_371640 [Iris pallida]